MAFQRPALNAREPIVELRATPEQPAGTPSKSFLTFMRGMGQDIDAAPLILEPVVAEAQTAAITTTAFPSDGDLSAGIYRVSWAAKVVTAAGVSSDFQVTISWTWKTVSQQWVGTLRNGNLTTTYDLASVPLLYVDAATPISYAVSYNSNPANAMAFDFFACLERLAAL